MRTTLIGTLLFAGTLFVINQSFAAPADNQELLETEENHGALMPGGITFSGHVIPAVHKRPSAKRFDSDSILVRFIPGTPSVKKAMGRQTIKGKKLRAYSIVPGLEHLRIGIEGLEVEKAIEILERLPFVEYAQPNYAISIDQTLPDDPDFPEQWALNNEGQSSMYGMWGPGQEDADINAPEAWDTITSSDILIAIIDTGIAYDHPDLVGNMWTNPNEIANNSIDDDGNGFVDDIHGWDFVNNDNTPYDGHGHGSHVAGIVAAEGNNGASVPEFNMGTSGVLWHGQLMALKALDDVGQGWLSDAMAALEYAVTMGAGISNNSWGYFNTNEPGHQALSEAIDTARENDHIFIAAAGNNGMDTDIFPHYPSGFELDNIISVAAIDWNGNLASFSNYGALSVDLAAPGADIFSTWKWSYGYPDYAWLSGTSMATPHVTGVAAMVSQQHQDWSYGQIRDRIFATVRPLPILGDNTVTGGVVDAAAAVAISGNPPTADFTYTTTELTAFFTDASDDSDGNIAYWNWALGDNATSTEQNPVHTYPLAGTYQVTLTVTDNDGATDAISQDVTVTTVANVPPVASFLFVCNDLNCSFNGAASEDTDGFIVAYHWDFGDGWLYSSPGPDTEHLYSSAGTYHVTLKVTDNTGASDMTGQDVTVNEPLEINTPTNLMAGVDGTSVHLNWDDTSTGEEGFEIERTEKVRGKYILPRLTTTGANVSSYTDSAVNPGTYRYHVRAFVGAIYSDYSNVSQVKLDEIASICGDTICGSGEDQCSCALDCGAPPATEAPNCGDTIDNDCDGVIDCLDTDCSDDESCNGCQPKGSLCTSDTECCSGACRGVKCK